MKSYKELIEETLSQRSIVDNRQVVDVADVTKSVLIAFNIKHYAVVTDIICRVECLPHISKGKPISLFDFIIPFSQRGLSIPLRCVIQDQSLFRNNPHTHHKHKNNTNI